MNEEIEKIHRAHADYRDETETGMQMLQDSLRQVLAENGTLFERLQLRLEQYAKRAMRWLKPVLQVAAISLLVSFFLFGVIVGLTEFFSSLSQP